MRMTGNSFVGVGPRAYPDKNNQLQKGNPAYRQAGTEGLYTLCPTTFNLVYFAVG
jgi:hypothetical protein